MYAAARALITFAVMAFATPSFSAFLTGAQWLDMTAQDQVSYIAGVYDALVTLVTNPAEAQISAHYQTCAARAKLTPEQMAANLKTYISDNPKFRAEAVPGAFLGYLIAACGKPQL
jgi:hypothetical protein